MPKVSEDALLTPSEVAKRLRVDAKTVTRWAKPDDEGVVKLPGIRTPGGHHRFRESDVLAIMRPEGSDPSTGIFVVQVMNAQQRVVAEHLIELRRGQGVKMDAEAIMYEAGSEGGTPFKVILPFVVKWMQ